MANFSTFTTRNIGNRLILNIVTFGQGSDQKIQSSIMYNIWKHSVVQRQNDEVLLTILFSIVLVLQTLILNDNFSVSFELDQRYLGGKDIFSNYELVQNLAAEKKAEYCRVTLLTAMQHSQAIDTLVLLIGIYSIGMLTSVVQKVIVVRFKENAQMNLGVLII